MHYDSRAQVMDRAYVWTIWPLVVSQGVLTFAAPYYNLRTGISIAALGLVYACARFYDALYDMLIGFLSDRSRSRLGRRRPFVAAGCIGMVAGMIVLCLPSGGSTIARFALGMFLFFSTWTMAFIPYLAHAGEITKDYDRRTTINLHQGVVQIAAGLSIYLVPYVLVDPDMFWLRADIGTWLADSGSSLTASAARLLLTPALRGIAGYGRVMEVLIWFTAVTVPITLFFYLRHVPDQPRRLREHEPSPLIALQSPVFRRFCLGYFLLMAGYMGRLSLFPFIVDYASGGQYGFLLLMLVQGAVGVLVTPLWSWIFRRVERGQAMMIAAATEAAGLVLMGFAGGESHRVALIAFTIMGLPGGTLYMLPYLMAGDAADYSELRSRSISRGVHVSIISMILKVGAVVSSLFLFLAGMLGFDPSRGVSAGQVMLIRTLGLYVPAALILLGGLLILTFPITRARQHAIQTRLARRRAPPPRPN